MTVIHGRGPNSFSRPVKKVPTLNQAKAVFKFIGPHRRDSGRFLRENPNHNFLFLLLEDTQDRAAGNSLSPPAGRRKTDRDPERGIHQSRRGAANAEIRRTHRNDRKRAPILTAEGMAKRERGENRMRATIEVGKETPA